MLGSFVENKGKIYRIVDRDQMRRYGFHLNLTKVDLSDRKNPKKKSMKRSVWVMKFNSETSKHDYSLKEKDT